MNQDADKSFEDVRQEAEATDQTVVMTVSGKNHDSVSFRTRSDFLDVVREHRRDDQKILKGLMKYIVFCFLGTALNLALMYLGSLTYWVGTLSASVLFVCGFWGIHLHKRCRTRVAQSSEILREWGEGRSGG